jgi:hypothetical protein
LNKNRATLRHNKQHIKFEKAKEKRPSSSSPSVLSSSVTPALAVLLAHHRTHALLLLLLLLVLLFEGEKFGLLKSVIIINRERKKLPSSLFLEE